jgi:hypothetical protein
LIHFQKKWGFSEDKTQTFYQKVRKVDRYHVMAEESRNGLRLILFSLYREPCTVPFQFPERQFDDGSDQELYLSVIDGKGMIRRQERESDVDKEEESGNVKGNRADEGENETQSPDENDTASKEKGEGADVDAASQKEENVEESKEGDVVIVNGNLENPVDDADLKDRVLKISSHLYRAIPNLFDVPITQLRLHFRQNGDILELISDSDCSISSKTFTKDKDDLEQRFAEFFAEEYTTKIDRRRCCCQLPDCGPADYRAPLSLLLLYKAQNRFPTANPGRLYTLILLRMTDNIDASCFCCIRCWHEMSNAQYVAYVSRIQTPEMRDVLPPRPFQPLVEAELCVKSKFPVGLGKSMHEPQSFVLNLKKSPYASALIGPLKPPDQVPADSARSKTRGTSVSDTVEKKWLEKVCALRASGGREVSRSSVGSSNGDTPELQPYQETGNPFERAAKHYLNPPFDVSMLDCRRKKGLHKRNDDQYCRFSPSEKFV